METNNYNTDLQIVSQRVSLRRGKSANQNKKFFNHLSPKKVWKIKGLIIAFLTAYFLLCHLSDSDLTQFSYVFLAILILIGTIELGCRLFGGKAKGM